MDSFEQQFAHILDQMVGKGKKFPNYRKLAQTVGTSPNTFTYLRQGKTQNPSPELLARISLALCNDSQYLSKLYAQAHLGIKALTDTEYEKLHTMANTQNAAKPIPVFNSSQIASMGPASFKARSLPKSDEFIPNPDSNIYSGSAFAFRIIDQSMTPRYMVGDFVLVTPGKPAAENKPAVFMLENGTCGCRLLKKSGDSVLFVPLNPEFEIITATPSQLLRCHSVSGMYRSEP